MSTDDSFLQDDNDLRREKPYRQLPSEQLSDEASEQLSPLKAKQDDIEKHLEGLPEHIASRIRLKLSENLESEKDSASASASVSTMSVKKRPGPNSQLMERRPSLRTVLGGMNNGKRTSVHKATLSGFDSHRSDSDGESDGSRKSFSKRNSKAKLLRRRSSAIRLVPGENSKEDEIPHYRRVSSVATIVSRNSGMISTNSEQELAPIIASTKASTDNYIYDIDSVGVASYQVSNLYILQRRSLPASRNHQLTGGNGVRGGLIPVQSHSMLLPSQQGISAALSKSYNKSIALLKSKSRSTFAGRDNDKKNILSSKNPASTAGGTTGTEQGEGSHLAYEYQKQVNDMSETILNQMFADRKHKATGSTDILMPYYSRAQAYERMKKTDKALDDYSHCIKIDPKFADAYYKRAELYQIQNKLDLALTDLNKAVSLDPSNIIYRTNRSMLLRQKGDYFDAIHETIICKTVELNPSLSELLKNGEFDKAMDMNLDSRLISTLKKELDPVMEAVNVHKKFRTKQQIEAIIDFISSMKFFKPYVNQPQMLQRIANVIDFKSVQKGVYIFEEGKVGSQFFMIYDGEVTIVKEFHKTENYEEITEQVALVKLFRGQTFGEVALDSANSIRTAGAIATQPTLLLVLNRADYETVTKEHKQVVYNGVYSLIKTVNIFRSETWTKAMLDRVISTAKEQSFAPNTDLIKVGEKTKTFYIIKLGVVKLVKPVLKSILKYAPPKNRQPGVTAAGGTLGGGGSMVSASSSSSLLGNNKLKKKAAASLAHENTVNRSRTPKSPAEFSVGFKPKKQDLRRLLGPSGVMSGSSLEDDDEEGAGGGDGGNPFSEGVEALSGSGSRSVMGSCTLDNISMSSVLDSLPSVTDEEFMQSGSNSLNEPSFSPKGSRNNSTKYRRANIKAMLSAKQSGATSEKSSTGRNVEFQAAFDTPTSAAACTAPLKAAENTEELWVIERNWKDNIDTYDNSQNDDKVLTKPQSRGASGVDLHELGIDNLDESVAAFYARNRFKKTDETVNFTVSVLGAGQVFGELAILDSNLPSPIAATAYTPVEVYAFDSELFDELQVKFMPESMQVLNEIMNIHNPPAEKLAYYFKEKLKWEMKKNRLLNKL